MHKINYFYLLELSVVYEDTRFGCPPHEADSSPLHLIVHSLSNCFIRLEI